MIIWTAAGIAGSIIVMGNLLDGSRGLLFVWFGKITIFSCKNHSTS